MGHPALGAHLKTSGGRDASCPVLHPRHPTPVLSLAAFTPYAICWDASANYARARVTLDRPNIAPSCVCLMAALVVAGTLGGNFHPGHPPPMLSLGGIPSNASCVVLVRSANYAKQSIVRSLVARQRILPSLGAPRTRPISHRLSCCSVVPDLPPFFAPGCSSHTSPVRRHVPTEQSCKFVEAMAAAHWYGGRVRSIARWSEMAEAALTVNSLADCYDLTLRRRRSARRAVAARHTGGREPCAPSR